MRPLPPVEPDKDGDVYQITTAAELYWFAALVNGDTSAETGTNGVEQNTAACAALTQNITVNSDVLNTDGSLKGIPANTWTPIGNDRNNYTGTFDGNNKTISGLYFSASETSYVGLFGYVSAGGKVKDVTVADSYIQAGDCVGGVCGSNGGTLTNCTNSGAVTGTGATPDGTTRTNVGGVCGYNGGTLENCTNAGTVSATGANAAVGGVCGSNATYGSKAALTNCYNTGAVSASGSSATIGGVCGNNSSTNNGTPTLTNCYNTGAVSASGSSSTIGGVCGNNSSTKGTATLANCYNTGDLNGGENATIGGVCGSYSASSNNATFTNCYYLTGTGTITLVGTTAKTAKQFASGEVAWLLNGSTATPADGKTLAWYQNLATEGGDATPVLKKTGSNTVYASCTYDTNGFATSTENAYSNTAIGATYYQASEPVEGVYQIKNAGNLYWFAALVNGDTSAATGTGGVKQNVAAKAKLVNTITVNTGVLNTDGTLKATPTRTWTPIGNDPTYPYVGTFDGNGKTISGLYFNDANNASSVGLFGTVDAGGTVQNVTVADSYIRAKDGVGGVCGVNAGTLTNCTNSGTVSATDAGASVGGVCGYMGGVRDVSTATVINSSNSGTVSATATGAFVGGVCGFNSDSTLTNCTNSGTVSGTGEGTTVGGVCGKNSFVRTTATLTNCTNTGALTGGENSKVGGVCGSNYAMNTTATLTNCYNTGALTGTTTGGVCGSNSAEGGTVTLTNCYNTGALTGTTTGGVCGSNSAKGGTATLTNCYNTGALTGTTTGGVCASNTDGTFTNCYYKAESETDTFDGTTAKTEAQFKSGEVAWLLDTAGVVDAHSKVWSQGTASPKFAKADGSDVVYRAQFLPKTGDTPVAAPSYLASGAALTTPAGYTWPTVPAKMAAADATYRWIAPFTITKQPTAPAAKTVGYTDKQSLSVEATLATEYESKTVTYQWKKDGTAISGATAATYTIPTGLGAGSYKYTCDVTCEGGTLTTTAVTFTVKQGTGTITDTKKYATSYTANGKAIANPATGDFTTNAGAISYTWYKGTTKLASAPADAGSYTLRVSAAATTNYTAATLDVAVTVKAAPTATPKPTAVPTATPKPTAAPTATPKPTLKPATDTAGFVDHLYLVCLDREADAAGKADWVNALTSYQISGTKAAYGFVFSKEFQDKKYSNEDYVEHLYEAVMGRKPDAAGKASWVAKLNAGMSREEVFYGFANSTEFDKTCASYGIVAKDIETFVTRLYSVCLDRKPDAAGLADWSAKLRNKEQTAREVAYGFIFSKEFLGKNYSNEDYVEHLYASFLGRKSEPAGKADWVNQLKNGKSREEVFDGFVYSKEFSEICANYGINRG